MPAPEKVAAFHVGAHKTGTSVFQRYLRENRRALRSRGIDWFRRRELAAAIGWGDRLLADPAPVTDRVAAFAEQARVRVLIASYENLIGPPFAGDVGGFYPHAGANLAALAAAVQAVPGVSPRVVLCVRPQAEFLESYYLQTVNQGGHLTFPQWLEGVDLDALSWRPLVDTLRASAGAVEVVDFRVIRGGQEAYLRHLLARIDPALASLRIRHAEVRNRSLSARGLEFALAVNPHLSTHRQQKALRRFLQAHFSNLDAPRPRLLDPHQRAALQARYAREYEDLVAVGSASTSRR